MLYIQTINIIQDLQIKYNKQIDTYCLANKQELWYVYNRNTLKSYLAQVIAASRFPQATRTQGSTLQAVAGNQVKVSSGEFFFWHRPSLVLSHYRVLCQLNLPTFYFVKFSRQYHMRLYFLTTSYLTQSSLGETFLNSTCRWHFCVIHTIGHICQKVKLCLAMVT